MSSHARRMFGISVAAASALAFPTISRAQVGVEVVHAFPSPGAVGPGAPLIQATDSSFYGTTLRGGKYDCGTIFRMTASGAVTVIHEFDCTDGKSPQQALVQASDGNLYGTAQLGGPGGGIVFRTTLGGAFAVVHVFAGGAEGRSPSSPLFEASDGNLYGTTADGGGANLGTVYRLTFGGAITTIHEFGVPPDIGTSPVLLGALFGTAADPEGGTLIFSVTTDGVYGVVHRFWQLCTPFGCTENGLGFGTQALIQTPDGFYGVNSGGGLHSQGTAFLLGNASGAIGLHAFGFDSIGDEPVGLTRGLDGNFYGVTAPGGGGGVVFRMDPTGAVTPLHYFNYTAGEGWRPTGSLVQASDGLLYGTTTELGGNAYIPGAAFSMTTSGDFSVRHAFIASTDGAAPVGIIPASDGQLYGTTDAGGAANAGTVFHLSGDGSLNLLHEFANIDSNPSQLVVPDGLGGSRTFMQAADGAFYGTTLLGGELSSGTLFQITSTGAYSVLVGSLGHTTDDFMEPAAPLIQASDGTFYGTTAFGGDRSLPVPHGDVFTWSAATGVVALHRFDGGTEGQIPVAALLQGNDGAFYGTTAAGGASGLGTVYRIASDGTVAFLHAFAGGADGAVPAAPLIQTSNGSFYGTTLAGGAADLGTVFRMTPAGSVAVLHAFNGSDGAYPNAALLHASDGNFYGVTQSGGANGLGTIFRLTSAGAFTFLHSFNGADGERPRGPLIQGADGRIYGVAERGGPSGAGVVFRLIDLSCEDALTLKYAAGTLTFGFTLRSAIPTQWSTWIAWQNNVFNLWAIQIPAVPIAVSFDLPIPGVPAIGNVGVLTTMSSPGNGVMCADWKIVDTGGSGPSAQSLSNIFPSWFSRQSVPYPR